MGLCRVGLASLGAFGGVVSLISIPILNTARNVKRLF